MPVGVFKVMESSVRLTSVRWTLSAQVTKAICETVDRKDEIGEIDFKHDLKERLIIQKGKFITRNVYLGSFARGI